MAVSMMCAIAAGGQAASPAALSASQRRHLEDERFGIVTAIRGLPLGVREELQNLFGGSLDIAEPGAPFQVTGVVSDARLPRRRLVLAGCSIDHCLVYYERAGTAHSWQAALFHWTPAATTLETGGTAPRGLKSIDDVKIAVLSGAITQSAGW